MPRPSLTELVARRVVIFDGAMGTELYNRHQFVNLCFEELCLSKPQLVRQIHREHRAAGADVLTTNSFGANRFKLAGHLLGERATELARSAAELAREVAADELLVAGSIGPLGQPLGRGGISEAEALAAFGEAARGLAEGGADFVILETFSRGAELRLAARAAGAAGLPYLPSMALADGQRTSRGETIADFFGALAGLPAPLMYGFNCGVGPRQLLEQLERWLPDAPLPVLVQPNAGVPQLVQDRWIYMTSPEYLQTYAQHFVQLGARAVGGCCGTTAEHVAALAHGVGSVHGEKIELRAPAESVSAVEPPELAERSRLGNRLARGQWVTLVELTPPLGWDLGATLEKAALCHRHGVDAINIPDGPRASARLSPLVTASAIQRQVGIEAVLHVTCRDKNVIGMQSDLLGCAAAGINNLLVITGDPPKLGDYPFATAVFDLDSIGLLRLAERLNHGIDIAGLAVRPPTGLVLTCGCDPSHLDQERELQRLAQKAQAGACAACTQPVYDASLLLRFIERARAAGVRLPFIAGLWPLVSYRNAEFLNNEVPGVHVPPALVERMRIASGRGKEAARAEGVAIARELLAQVRPHVAGVMISAPLGNAALALAVCAA